MPIDWGGSYTAGWRVFRVNEETWEDASEVSGIRDIRIERRRGAKIESGSMTVDAAVGQGFDEGFYRIALYASQGGAVERHDIATLLMHSFAGSIDRGSDEIDVTGTSVLQDAADVAVADGLYAPAGSDGAAFAASLLSDAMRAPVSAEGSFTLDNHVVFDPGGSVLDAARLILDAGGFEIFIDGRGRATVAPIPSNPALALDDAGASIISPGIEYDRGWGDVPNRYIAVGGRETAVAVNDDPSSPVSTVARRRYVDSYDASPKQVNGETLQAYAARRLLEASTVSGDSRTYTREYAPGVYPGCIVRGSLASVDLLGDMRVESQRIECGAGVKVTEKSEKEDRLWQP